MNRMTLTHIPSIPDQYQPVILQALRALYERLRWNMQEHYGLHDLPLLADDELLRSLLADVLASIARAAAGQREHSEFGDGILHEEIQSVCEALFASPATYSYQIPAAFWESDLGQMIARARLWLMRDELITLSQAAELLGISIQAVSAMATDGRLTVYVDPDVANPTCGRRLVSRGDVERLRS